MRKHFLFWCALILALGSWCWCAPAAPQQGSSAPSSSGNSSAQDATPPNDVPTPDDPVPDANADGTHQDQSVPVGGTVKDPTTGERVKKGVKDRVTSPWCVGAPLNHCFEKKQGPDADKTSGNQNGTQNRIPAPPRSDDSSDDSAEAPPMTKGESSSKDTKVDLSPPVGDAADHPDSSPDPSAGPAEFHAWDPHRAMKNVEVGDYYFKRENYRAAASRYQEALQWKPRDAEATYKLAEAYEKMGDAIDARHNFEQYLSILPKGPRAEEAHKALARLEQK